MGKRGRQRKGLPLLAEALAMVDKTGERFYEAELYRLKGELTLAPVQSPRSSSLKSPGQSEVPTSSPSPAEQKPRRAFSKPSRLPNAAGEVAGTARSDEPSRLWQQQGKKEEAHELLAEIYGWFTEGFDTKDLQEAKALLESLSS